MWTFTRRAAQPPRARPALPPADEPIACGWFESSHDLQAGLVVQEHADVSALTRDLPLDDWMTLYFASGSRAETRVRDDRGLQAQGAQACGWRGVGGSESSWPCWPPAAAAART